jgi:hypothetical protein
MSTPFDPSILTRRTAADMSSSEWLLVKPNGSDDMDVCGANDLAIGALTNDVADGSSTAVYLPVQVGGIIKVKCGGSINAGQQAGSDGSGNAVAVAGAAGGGTDSHTFGIALQDAANGDVAAFLWAPAWIETT